MATTVHALPKLLLTTKGWNLEIESGPRVPITVGYGSSMETQVRELWGSVASADVDKVNYANVEGPPESPPSHQAAVTASGVGPPSGLVRGYAEEGVFVDKLLHAPKVEASQYGAVFYHADSSWCPAAMPTVCQAGGPMIGANLSAVHSAPVLFNIHASLALKSSMGGGTMQVSNHPFQKTATQRAQEEFVSGILAALIIMVAYGFFPAGTTAYVVMEKEKDVKNQLIISGCSHSAYWVSNFIFDILWGLIPAMGAWITFRLYGIDSFIEAPGLAATIWLFLAYLPAAAGFSYLFSFLFKKAGVAIFVAWIFNMIFGVMSTMIISILDMLPDSVAGFQSALRWLCRFVPVYSLGWGHLMISVQQRRAVDKDVGPLVGFSVGQKWCPADMAADDRQERLCVYMVGDEFFALCIAAVVYFGLTIFLDVFFGMPKVKAYFRRVYRFQDNTNTPSLEDDMVKEEITRVEGLNTADQFVYVNKIHKTYNGCVRAVRGISFAASSGQVFGLLGVNGAGKTTTFKILCGQVEPDEGQVFIQGYDISTQAGKARKQIGYCPQFDALLDSLTSREHLYMYGRIKGLHGQLLADAVDSTIADLDLGAFTNSRAGKLSGGNKRKLSVAMAVIGEPPMVFLDEPSAGMDPVARRGMWGVIQNIADKRQKSVVILTTHSMEEAEALCSRIAIQVDGQFRCLGTAQQIKHAYGQGLELNIRFATPKAAEIQACCAELGVDIHTSMQQPAAYQLVATKISEAVAQELIGPLRPGSPLAAAAHAAGAMQAPTVQANVLAEWALWVIPYGAHPSG
jgi:ATP-binding cassette subfamily A (ABC1) protein 3